MACEALPGLATCQLVTSWVRIRAPRPRRKVLRCLPPEALGTPPPRKSEARWRPRPLFCLLAC